MDGFYDSNISQTYLKHRQSPSLGTAVTSEMIENIPDIEKKNIRSKTQWREYPQAT